MFGANEITITVEQAGAFVETVPLLVGETSTIAVRGNAVALSGGGTTFVIAFEAADAAPILVETGASVNRKRVVAVRVRATNKLRYQLTFAPPRS